MNLFNARAEGDSNKEDNPSFRGAAGIIQKKAFRKPIRSQRCLVIASAFIEGPPNPGFSKPYMVYLRNHQNPFAMAGIWDTWYNPVIHETIYSFSIITTTANSLLRKISNSRMPVILSDREAIKWINPETELSCITGMLNHCDSKLMNAYPVSPRINNPDENDKLLIQPAGARLLPEDENKSYQRVVINGYHHSTKEHKGNTDSTTMADRIDQKKIE